MKFVLRTGCFLLGLVLLLYAANTFLIQTDTLSYLTLHELTHRDDIEIAFVGSSVARNHFEPAVVKAETGLTAFNLALPYMSLQGSYAASRLLYAHHTPEWTVLVAEPYWFTAERESPQTQFRLMPFIKNPIDRLAYYVDLCTRDGRWLDRLLLPRMFGVENPEQLIKTLRIHLDPEAFYREQREKAASDVSATYQGSGYMHPGFGIPEAERLRIAGYRGKDTGIEALPEYAQEAILRIKALCEASGSKLMVVVFPYMTAAMLAEPDYLACNDLLADFCARHDVPCFDFTLAKESLMQPLDPYFQNTEHMSVEGTMVLSRAFCEVFNRYTAGEDVSGLFYGGREEYLASVRRVTNVWLETDAGQGTYRADCHHGTGIAPEYRFAAVAPDGSETMLRDYEPEMLWQGSVPHGHTLRVYARPQQMQQQAVYFDLQ